MNVIEVRKARFEDVSSICLIQSECKLSPWPRSAYEAEVTRKDAIILMASNEGGDAVGFITGRLIPGDTGSSPQAEIYNLGVYEAFRLHGIGSALLKRFLDACAGFGVGRIFLEVRESNLSAIRFYGAHGFRKAGERKNFYTDPVENAEIMARTLNDAAEP